MNILIYIVLIIVLIINLNIFAKYNSLVKLYNETKKEKSSIDIYSNKRIDIIPNLVECIKSYSKYEKETLENIVSLRNDYKKEDNINIKKLEKMNNELNKYLAVVEAYPDLKANTQYLKLHDELTTIENELERARHKYNDVVTNYNIVIESVPSNIVAAIFGFKKAELFKVEENKKENIKVKL